jgi:flagellar FliL protein
MADNDQAEKAAANGDAPAAPRSRLKLIVLAVAVLCLVGGAGTWFFFFRHHGEDQHAEAPPPKPPAFVDVPEMLVNLVGAPGEREQ